MARRRHPSTGTMASGMLLLTVALVGAPVTVQAQTSAANVSAIDALERDAVRMRDAVLRARAELSNVQMESVAVALLPSGPRHPEFADRASTLPRLATALRDAQRRLIAQDARIDAALTREYARLDPRAVRLGRVSRETTRLALLHWTILMRRAAAAPAQTRVPELRKASFCEGDAIANRLAWTYLERSSRLDAGTRPAAGLVQALAAYQRQLSCLDGRRLLLLDAYLVSAFDTLERRLQAQQLQGVLRSVVDRAAELMLLSFDAAKFHGQRSASFQWWRKNAGLVRAGVTAGRSALSLHGVWLFDRHAGRLVGLRARCSDPRAVDCADAALLVTSISTPANLGNGDCSFLDMIRRGDGPRGYQCTGSVCNPGEPSLAQLRSPAEVARPGGLILPRPPTRPTRGANERRSLCPNGAFSPFGTPCAEVSALCSAPNRGAAGDRSATCGQPANALRDPKFRCATSRMYDAPVPRLLRCFAEANASCEAPLDRLSKQLTASSNRVPNAAGCRVVADEPASETARDFEQKKREALARIDDPAYKEQVQKAVEAKVRERDPSGFDRTSFNQNFEQAYAAMRVAVEEAVLGPEAPGGPNAIASTVGGDLIVFSEDKFVYYTRVDPARVSASFVRDSFLHEGLHALGSYLDPESLLLSGEDEHAIARRLGLPDCPPDSPTCSGACPYGTAQLGERQPCMLEPDRERSDPGYVDPSPLDAPTAPAWARCFASLADPQSSTQRVCLGVDCALGMHCDPSVRGRCVADVQAALPANVPAGCRNFILCPPGEPLSFDGRLCRCGERTMDPVEPAAPAGPQPRPRPGTPRGKR